MQRMFGFHTAVRNREALTGITEVVCKYMAPKGLTHAILQIDNRVQFKTHPELISGDLSLDDLRETAEKMRAVGVEPVPLYNCFGHQGWGDRNALLKNYPEFEENPEIPDDKFYKACLQKDGSIQMLHISPAWCGNEPRIFDIVLPVMDEIVDAMQCKYIHLGMDEIFFFAHCDRCKHMTPAQLFYQTFMRFYDHFHARGVGIMLWADRLLNATKLLGEAGLSRWYDYETVGTSECLDKLPKDIIPCNWHYDVEENYPSTGELIRNGIAPWPSCWYETPAAEALWKSSLKQAEELGRVDLLPGMLCTCWGTKSPLIEMFSTDDPSTLAEEDAKLVKTFYRMAEYMEEYFKKTQE